MKKTRPNALPASKLKLRKSKLKKSHMKSLCAFVKKLRKKKGVKVPDFDPYDGGDRAKVLFLFEKPGPMTVKEGSGKREGSGFISRNNDDPTAEATWRFMNEAGIPRDKTVTWNVVPWWNGTRKVYAKERIEGLAQVIVLIELLPKLKVVVFVGKKAAKARKLLTDNKLLAGKELHLIESAHPSPIVKAAYRDRWDAIPSEWAKAKPYI